MKTSPAKSALALCLLLTACGSTKIVDSVDTLFDFFTLSGPSGTLHRDYVAGAKLDFYILGDHEDVSGYSLAAADPTIVQIGQREYADSDQVEFDATMVGAGDTTLYIVDGSGNSHDSTPVHVAFPDAVDLVPSGPLFIGDDAQTANAPQIVAGGLATFQVRYSENGSQLYGSGGLVPSSDPEVSVAAETTFLNEVRDWVQVTASSTPGASTLTLSLLGKSVDTVPISVVDDSDIASVKLVGESEKHRSSDASLALLAESFTSDDAPVWGVAYQFTVDGEPQDTTVGFGNTPGEGFPVDMYIYKYDKSKPVNVEASHNGLSDGVLIHSDGGYVASSDNIGCSAAPGRPGAPAALIVLACLALYAATSRRRA